MNTIIYNQPGTVPKNSAALRALLTDETGTGSAVFANTPTIVTPVINGVPTGTGVNASDTPSTLAARDANGNLLANNFVEGYGTTTTAAGTTTLSISDDKNQYFTGVTTQTIQMPVTSTLSLGFRFRLTNLSTGNLTINSSGGNLIATIPPNTSLLVTCILTSGTTAASWNAGFDGFGSDGLPLTGMANLIGPTVIGKETGTGVPIALTPAQLLTVLGAGLELVVTATVTGSAATEIDTGVFSPAGALGDRYIVCANMEINGACSYFSELNGRTITTDYIRGVCNSGVNLTTNTKPESVIVSACKLTEFWLVSDNFFSTFTSYNGGHAFPALLSAGTVTTNEKFSRIRWYTSVASRIAIGSKITVWRIKP